MITFRPILMTLFSGDFILNVCLSFVDLLDNLTDTGINLLICLNFLSRINEKDVCSSCCLESMFLFTPAFADSALEKIALHSPFEHFLWH